MKLALAFLALTLSTLTFAQTPNKLLVKATAHSATLTWPVYPVSGVLFTVNRGAAPGQETTYEQNVSASPFVDSGVTAGTTYYYTIMAVCTPSCQTGFSGTSGVSNEVKAVIPSDPTPLPNPVLNAPTVAGTPPVVDLTWQLATVLPSPITHQFIQRQQAKTGVWVTQHQLKPTVTSYIDAGVKRGTNYPYRIEEIPSKGAPLISNVVIAQVH